MPARHRGPDPRDAELFAPACVPVLREAVGDLSWLLARGYSDEAAVTLVGDRYQLAARARVAVARMAAAPARAADRRARRVTLDQLRDRELAIDGWNALVTGESALAGAVILRGADGALRDLASVHGSYRHVDETARVIAAYVDALTAARPRLVRWFLDRPVSNSGRIAARLREVAGWEVELVDVADPVLARWPGVVATADSWILDRCAAWVDLPAAIAGPAWIVDGTQA